MTTLIGQVGTTTQGSLRYIGNGMKMMSAETIAATAAAKGFTAAQTEQILIGAGVAEEEIAATLATVGFAEAEVGATGATVGFGAALKGTAASMAAFLTTNPVGIILLIAGAVFAATKAYDAMTLSMDEAIDKASKSREAYETTQNEISSLNSELESINSRIAELKAQGSLSIVESQELAQLEAQNAMLERQLEIKQRLAEHQAQAAAQDANTALTNKAFFFNDDAVDRHETRDYRQVDIITEAARQQEELNELTEKRNNLIEQQSKLDSGTREYKNLAAEIENTDNKINSLGKSLSENLSIISEQEQSLYDANGNVISGYEETAQRITELWDKVASASDKAKTKQETLNNILGSSDLESSTERAIKKAKELNGLSINDIVQQFPELASAASDAGVGLTDLVNTINSMAGTINVDEVKNQIQQVFDFNNMDMKGLNEWLDSLDVEDLEILYKVVKSPDAGSWGLDELKEQFKSAKASAESSADAMSTALENAVSKTKSRISEISAAQNLLTSQATGKSISLDDFSSDDLKGYTSALEYNNGTLQLNAEKVRELVQEKSKEQLAINDTNKALAQSEYLKNAAEIERLRESLKGADADTKEYLDTQGKINVLQNRNSDLKEQCMEYDLLSQSLREATDAYHNWLNAQNASESGDMFDDALNAMKHINDTLVDSDSDFFGRVGREDYKAAVDFVVPDSVDHEDEAAVKSYMSSVADMFTYDSDGNRSGLNIDNFCQKAVDEGLMVFDEASDSYKVAGQMTMEDFAEGMNMSLPMVQAMFGEMQEFGGEFTWADEASKTLGDLGIEANEAAEAIRQIEGNEDIEIRLDVSDLETKEEKVSALESTVKQMQDLKSSVDVDSSQVDQANSVIEYCIAQMQLLDTPTVMKVDTTAISDKMAEAISKIQEFKQASNELELKQQLGVDTTDAQANVEALAGEISGIDPNILATLEIDTTSITGLQTSINAISPEMLVKLGIDDTAIAGYTADTKESTVKYNPDTTALPESFPALSRDVNYVGKTASLPTSFSTITRYVNYVATGDTGGGHSVNGTAHVFGTAKAGGDWGTALGGTTLVGELGREIVVDPRTGRWYTVGDTGAEFVHIPKGAIVFNHRQTESLLEYGYVTGRASALVGGTAMVSGGIKRKRAQSSTTGKSTKSTSSNKSSSGSSSSKNNSKSNSKGKSKSSSSSKDDEPEVIDWIEVAIERIERAIKNLKSTAESTYKALKTKLGATADEISQVSQELDLQIRAYDRYIQQANSVGLSEDLAELVRNGTIDISEYDKDTAELIKDYQEWYEKALDVSDAVQELHESLASLYEDNFNNIQDDYENQLSLLGHLTKTYEIGIDALEAKGYLQSTKYYAALQNVQKQNIDIMKRELADLTNSFSEAMSSGEIEEGSEAWYNFQQNINDVKEAIAEANVKALEFAKTIRETKWSYFDFTQDRISQITKEADFFIELLSKKNLYQDNGQFSNEGLATAGLRTQNYNVYMAQADKYAKEILEIDKELANDKYNTELIERREELLGLQQESILAAEEEKQAIVDLVEEGIEIELDSLKELIDTYKDSLSNAKDLYEYQKKIADKTSDIAKIQKQLSAYENDVSEETRAKVQQLRIDLVEAKEDLEETEYEKFISDTKLMLDNLYNEYEEILNERLDNVDTLLQDIVDMVNANATTVSESVTSGLNDSTTGIIGSIANGVTGITQSINQTLHIEASDVGYKMTTQMNEIWSKEESSIGDVKDVVATYSSNFSGEATAIKGVLNKIEANTAAMIENSEEEAEEVIAKTRSTTAPITPAQETQIKEAQPTYGDRVITDDVIKGIATAIWVDKKSGWGNDPFRSGALSKKIGADNAKKVQAYINANANSGKIYSDWVKEGKPSLAQYRYSAFKTGGLVDFTGLAQLDGTKTHPELVLSAQDTENFLSLRDTLRALSKNEFEIAGQSYNVGEPNLSGLTDISGILTRFTKSYVDAKSTTGDCYIDILIDHVQDYNDFVAQLQKDKQFEKMIRSMSTDQLLGASPLAKNKYRWG